MDTTVILAIIISTVVALGIVVLVIMLFYYHWRNQELMVNFSAFIRENLRLKDEIDNLRESPRVDTSTGKDEQSSGVIVQEEKEELSNLR